MPPVLHIYRKLQVGISPVMLKKIQNSPTMPTGSFGGRLKWARLERGLTLEQLAEKVGVTQGLLSHYESGRVKQPRFELLFSLAGALNVGPRWLALGAEGHFDLINITPVEAEMIRTMRKLAPNLRQHLVETASALLTASNHAPPIPAPQDLAPAKKRR